MPRATDRPRQKHEPAERDPVLHGDMAGQNQPVRAGDGILPRRLRARVRALTKASRLRTSTMTSPGRMARRTPFSITVSWPIQSSRTAAMRRARMLTGAQLGRRVERSGPILFRKPPARARSHPRGRRRPAGRSDSTHARSPRSERSDLSHSRNCKDRNRRRRARPRRAERKLQADGAEVSVARAHTAAPVKVLSAREALRPGSLEGVDRLLLVADGENRSVHPRAPFRRQEIRRERLDDRPLRRTRILRLVDEIWSIA